MEKQIERERAAGAVILFDPHGGGYYLSSARRADSAALKVFFALAFKVRVKRRSSSGSLDAATAQEPIEGW